MPIDDADIAAALELAPAWAKLGLSMRDERMREQAALELSRHIAARLNKPRPGPIVTIPR